MEACGLLRYLREEFDDEEQGWSTAQVVMTLILLNLIGGDCVRDIEVLEEDERFRPVYRRVELSGYSRKERREIEI